MLIRWPDAVNPSDNTAHQHCTCRRHTQQLTIGMVLRQLTSATRSQSSARDVSCDCSYNYDVNKSLLRDIYQRPGFLLKRCHQVTAALFANHCSKFNITPSQYGALAALRELPGIDQLALGRLIGLDRSTAGLVIKLLSERGLVQRSVSDRDSRSMHLTLTSEGRRLLAEIEPAANRAQRAALVPLPTAKRSQFLALLEMFLRGHGAVIDPASVVAGKAFGSRFDALHVAPPHDAKYSGRGRKVHSRSNRSKHRKNT